MSKNEFFKEQQEKKKPVVSCDIKNKDFFPPILPKDFSGYYISFFVPCPVYGIFYACFITHQEKIINSMA